MNKQTKKILLNTMYRLQIYIEIDSDKFLVHQSKFTWKKTVP